MKNMKKTIISSAIILCIALAVVTCIIIKNSAKLPDPVKAESISQLVPTAGTAKPGGFSRHSYIKRDPPVDGYEKALTAVQITALFSGNDILQLQEKGTKDLNGCRVLYYKDGSIHTIWLLDQEKSISFTIDPDCDPPGPVKYGIIPEFVGRVPVIVYTAVTFTSVVPIVRPVMDLPGSSRVASPSSICQWSNV